MKAQMLWHVCVLIPARNEEELLPPCLRSVLAAKAALEPSATVDIVVAADSSIDRTTQIAKNMLETQGVVLNTDAGTVGTARCLAARLALARHKGPAHRCWLANTDADCVVPPAWLIEQIRFANEGIEAIAGTVRVDNFEEHGPEVPGRFRASYVVALDGSHSHVHGANLGVRADAYLRAGGWGDLSTAEDHDLWRRLFRAGAVTHATNRTEIATSGRRVGRAPHGFAGALAAHNETAA